MFFASGWIRSAGRISMRRHPKFSPSSSILLLRTVHARRRQESATVIFPLQVRAAKIADPVAVIYPGIVFLNPLNRQSVEISKIGSY
jgi:hypothetical protein